MGGLAWPICALLRHPVWDPQDDYVFGPYYRPGSGRWVTWRDTYCGCRRRSVREIIDETTRLYDFSQPDQRQG